MSRSSFSLLLAVALWTAPLFFSARAAIIESRPALAGKIVGRTVAARPGAIALIKRSLDAANRFNHARVSRFLTNLDMAQVSEAEKENILAGLGAAVEEASPQALAIGGQGTIDALVLEQACYLLETAIKKQALSIKQTAWAHLRPSEVAQQTETIELMRDRFPFLLDKEQEEALAAAQAALARVGKIRERQEKVLEKLSQTARRGKFDPLVEEATQAAAQDPALQMKTVGAFRDALPVAPGLESNKRVLHALWRLSVSAPSDAVARKAVRAIGDNLYLRDSSIAATKPALAADMIATIGASRPGVAGDAAAYLERERRTAFPTGWRRGFRLRPAIASLGDAAESGLRRLAPQAPVSQLSTPEKRDISWWKRTRAAISANRLGAISVIPAWIYGMFVHAGSLGGAALPLPVWTAVTLATIAAGLAGLRHHRQYASYFHAAIISNMFSLLVLSNVHLVGADIPATIATAVGAYGISALSFRFGRPVLGFFLLLVLATLLVGF